MNDVEVWTEHLTDAVARVAHVFFSYLPSVLGSIALLLIGWLVARLLRSGARKLTERLLERLSRQRIARMNAIGSHAQQSQTYKSAPLVVGAIVYFTVLLFFVAAAIEALGLPAISNVLSLVTAYLPRVLAAALIVFIGLWIGDFVNTLVQSASSAIDVSYAPAIGRGLQILIGVVFLIIAVGQLGIDSSVLVITLAIVFASTFGAAALAFGLGARTTVSNIIAARYVRRQYQAGDTVHIGELQGRVTDITDTAVMLESAEGNIMVPAVRFAEDASLLVKRGG